MAGGFGVPGEAVEGLGAFAEMDDLGWGDAFFGLGAVGLGGVEGEEHLLRLARSAGEVCSVDVDGRSSATGANAISLMMAESWMRNGNGVERKTAMSRATR